ncbi:MAG: ComF family protein [Candidatus Omnitrophota bacterium]|nr:MAG: ComF family protein [Candidatus Omnitrophota bacterium]
MKFSSLGKISRPLNPPATLPYILTNPEQNDILLPMKNVLGSWNKIGKGLLNLVYPLECQICKIELGPFKESCLCNECKGRIRLNLPPFCLKCGKSLINSTYTNAYCQDCMRTTYHFRRAWATGHYQGILKDCIHLFKFNGKLCLLPAFTELFLNFTKLYIKINEFDAIIPVPLHKTKIRERTFNQAELLANDFSRRNGIPVYADNLIKAKHTPPQTELSKEGRASNIKGAFKITDSSFLKGKNILLMDDVFTTGYTLNECAKILLEGGAGSVACLVLARG